MRRGVLVCPRVRQASCTRRSCAPSLVPFERGRRRRMDGVVDLDLSGSFFVCVMKELAESD